MATENFPRRTLTFEQAEGLAPLPRQLAKGQISKVIKARLWDALHSELAANSRTVGAYSTLNSRMFAAVRDLFIRKYGVFSDSISSSLSWSIKNLRPLFDSEDYSIVLGATEWIARQTQWSNFPEKAAAILIEERSAYRLIDGQDIILFASEFEGQALTGALESLQPERFQGARTHLKLAASNLSHGQYADSIRESMQSIESVARTISPSPKFSDALIEIEKSGSIHSALRKGLLSFYGYSSDEQGIRHPLLESGDAAVKEEDALLMLGICSAAVTYLISKA